LGGAFEAPIWGRPMAYIIYLQDANLVVQTDENENVVSWKSEPIR
jgi:hypothetical protein